MAWSKRGETGQFFTFKIAAAKKAMAKSHIIFIVGTIAFLIIYGILGISPVLKGVIFYRKNDFTLGQLQAVTEKLRVNTNNKDAKEIKLDKRVQDIKYKDIVKTRNSGVYMYSAIQNNLDGSVPKKRETPSTEEPTKVQMSKIVVSGWKLNQFRSSNFICCHMMEDGTVIPISSSEKTDIFYNIQTVKLNAQQYTCHIINNSTTQLISIESSGSVCPIDKKYYKVVENVFPNSTLHQNNRNKTIAVCTKLAYGSLDAKKLIEWFEVHRMFGVDKVFSYLYQLNSAARKVFEYYENLGMAETRQFDLADKESVSREAGDDTSKQYWNDEHVALYDCQERARNFDYFAVVDTDEFIVPSTNVFKNAWKTFLHNIFQKPDIAGFLFPVSIHMTTWGPSKPYHSLFIGQYNNCTLPWFNRPKGIHMPSRVQPGSVYTHGFKPLPGYKKELVDGELAYVHHFRSCRDIWLKPRSVKDIEEEMTKLYYLQNAAKEEITKLYYLQNETECYDFRRFPSDIMQRVANAVQESVIRVINEIGV